MHQVDSPVDRYPAEVRAKLRVALFTGNYNYIKDGVSLTLNRLVDYLQRCGIAVLGKLLKDLPTRR